MSEIIIGKNDLQNSIIKDSKIALGRTFCQILNSQTMPYIKSSSYGSIAAGYVVSGTNMPASFPGIHANGYGSIASGYVYNVEDGNYIKATGHGATAFGYAEGSSIYAKGNGAHAEGYAYYTTETDDETNTETVEDYFPVIAIGGGAHAEGVGTQALNEGTHAEGLTTIASGKYSHAEGSFTEALSTYSHAEGYHSSAQGTASHAEGSWTAASGTYSHAEGYGSIASGTASHASGHYTIADQNSQFVCGKFNTRDNAGSLFVVGSGTNSYTTARKDAFVVSTNSIRGVVNDINDVIIGEPIGTMTMWMGFRGWDGYSYPLEFSENSDMMATGIPKGYVLANGGSIRLRYNGSCDNGTRPSVCKYRNKTDYVYIPRYWSESDIPNDVSYYDKFQIVAYRATERFWCGVESEKSKCPPNAQHKYSEDNVQNCSIHTLKEDTVKNLTRFLNHIILYTTVYTYRVTYQTAIGGNIIIDDRPTLVENTNYFINSSANQAEYLESSIFCKPYAAVIRHESSEFQTWYENKVEYSTNRMLPHAVGAQKDDIIIEIPNMAAKVPLGAWYAYDRNFGNVSTMMPNGTYANLYPGVTGGEEFATPGKGVTVQSNAQGDNDVPNVATKHNNIPPYMAVNFIVKYK